jgi:hypothetical protein
MKRFALVFLIVSVLLLADGIYLELSNNQQGCGCNGDSGTLFGGSTKIFLSTGTEVLIGGGFLLIVSIIILLVATMRGRGQVGGGRRVTGHDGGQRRAGPAPEGERRSALTGSSSPKMSRSPTSVPPPRHCGMSNSASTPARSCSSPESQAAVSQPWRWPSAD